MSGARNAFTARSSTPQWTRHRRRRHRDEALDVDLALPLPPHLGLYLYSLVLGGKSRAREFKAVFRVPGQVVGEYGAFDHPGERLALLAGY